MTPVPKQEHTLIFEPLSGGHRSEFVGHVLDHIRLHGTNGQLYTFVIAADLSIGDHGPWPDGVLFERITDLQEIERARSHSPLAGFDHWKILKRYAERLKPDRIILLDLTYLELPLCFFRLPCPFSGILFVQYPELQWVDSLDLRGRLKFRLKEIKTATFMRNRMLRSIHLLNGGRACEYLNQRFKTNCFLPIPDPVDRLEPEAAFNLRKHYSVGNDRSVFLFFGSMSPRKGVKPLIDAIASLPADRHERAAFVFCGQPEAGYADRYRELIAGFRKQYPSVHLHADESFVSQGRMRAMFAQADWILIPNLRPEYSSGILGHAVAAGTPVIGPRDGLVGRQIQENHFGLVADTDSASLASAIGKAVDNEYVIDEISRQRFLQTSSPDQFAERLLNG